jgi:hypothetical protein
LRTGSDARWLARRGEVHGEKILLSKLLLLLLLTHSSSPPLTSVPSSDTTAHLPTHPVSASSTLVAPSFAVEHTRV